MIESQALCKRFAYHKNKLAYLLTCMREYSSDLAEAGYKVIYHSINEGYEFEELLIKHSNNFDSLEYYEIPDKAFAQQIELLAKKYFKSTRVIVSPQFLFSTHSFANYLSATSKKRLLMNDFYIYHRKKINLLIDRNSKPVGGRWTFDDMNRNRLPKNQNIPSRESLFSSQHWQEVAHEVNTRFENNPGNLEETSWIPVNSTQAVSYLEDFLTRYLELFGKYEDSLSSRDIFLFHSVISPMLNNGLLTPQIVLNKLAQHVNTQYKYDIFDSSNSVLPAGFPIGSVEGFIRQIIGWREWVKGMYDHKYSQNLSSYNFFECHKSLPAYFWNFDLLEKDQETAKNLPLKLVLQKIHKYGWCHHIERLMILSNWMLLSEYDPIECYEWFMSMFVDAYEWVMVPNVLGMGLFADGGIFATKPYISGGNYIKKMSDYTKSEQWDKIWTDKFWNFIKKHEEYFARQPRLSMLLKSKTKI